MMPSVVTTLVNDGLNHVSKSIRGSKIMILGVAYKKNVSDCRESPALDVMRLLADKGAILSYNTPLFPHYVWAEACLSRSMRRPRKSLNRIASSFLPTTALMTSKKSSKRQN
jgi:UDP-N-acetyl-D-mannosaminuronate dehydrogenase